MARALDLSLRSYASQTLRHSHAYHQIVLPVAGVLEMEVAGKGGQVTSCQAALIVAGEDHSCEAAGDNCFVVLDWTTDDADDAGPADAGAHLEPCGREPIRHQARRAGLLGGELGVGVHVDIERLEVREQRFERSEDVVGRGGGGRHGAPVFPERTWPTDPGEPKDPTKF